MRGISFTAFVRTVERRRWRFLPAAAAAVLAAAVGTGAAFANVPLTRVSTDTFTNSTSQHVIVPFTTGSQIRSFRSINGGQSWRATVLVANVTAHTIAGGIRVDANAPSAEIDAAGTVSVAWSDCRFRPACPSNDILISESTSETTWGAPFRVPIDPTTSTVDHFIPGLGVDTSTSGSGAPGPHILLLSDSIRTPTALRPPASWTPGSSLPPMAGPAGAPRPSSRVP